ncbi:F0F1 ATP synthase subunit delta [Agrococcus carbonis]|uniref:ATP synthase subunit delta n=1 Tax=Agrococcus carbonis TaxID=684552 RepID=A0A1H1S880_9MICO|nr:F0F1 ATP synthase subunit delta [Agrococcus carbonis]SDS44131.1 ATP synthase F1 subcomplex delta subunit [Agrococcus carbonis]
MGSATSQARAGIDEALRAQPQAGLEDARELFQASRAIERSPQVLASLADAVSGPDARAALAQRVLGQLGAPAVSIVAHLARQRWSEPADLLAAIDAAGIRVAVQSAGETDVAGEIASFQRIVASDADLELALGGLRGSADDKARLVERLLAGKASPAAAVILDHLVRAPRGRRIGQLLRSAATEVAAAAGRSLAVVTTARAMPEAQLDRLRAGLERQYGRTLQLQQIVDPEVLGGLRVSIGDDIIDGTVRSKFTDLRLKLG